MLIGDMKILRTYAYEALSNRLSTTIAKGKPAAGAF